MIKLRHLFSFLLGACILGALMNTTPTYDDVFKPMRSTSQSGKTAQGRLYAARLANWQTADHISFNRYGTHLTRDTDGIFLVVDIDIQDVQESLRLSASWLGRSGRRYEQTTRVDSATTLNVRQFHPGLQDQGRAVFELPPDEIEGGSLLLARPGPNLLDSELELIPDLTANLQHHTQLELE